jgi:hypothetical protein
LVEQVKGLAPWESTKMMTTSRKRMVVLVVATAVRIRLPL